VTESLHGLSGAYVVDALDDEERAAFERHLPRCLDCQAEVASLREAAALMADESAITPPASLRSSVLSGIQTVRPLPPPTGSESGSEAGSAPASGTADESSGEGAQVLTMRPRRFRVARMVAAAAAVIAVGVGTVVYQPWQDDTSTVTLSAADQVMAASDVEKVSKAFQDGSTATIYRSASEGRAVLLTKEMAAPPSGKAYELWLRDEAGTMKPAGLMTTAGDHKLVLDGDATEATAVGITVEPEQGSAQPTSEPIAMFDLGEADA